MSADRCLACGGYTEHHRMTLPRAKTGDLVFCGFQCMERWRVRKFERFMAEERFVQLAADAIERQHPQADWLVAKGVPPVALSDAALEAANERLETWLAEHTGNG